MKKFKILFLLFITFFLFGCTNNSSNSIKISIDKDVIRAGDEVFINVESSKLGNFVYLSSDESIASVDQFGFLTAIKPGNVTITVYLEADEELKTSIDIEILEMTLSDIKINGETRGNIGDVLDLKYIQYPRGMEERLSFKSSDANIASVDNNGIVTLKSSGICEITITSESGFEKVFKVGAFDLSSILVLAPDVSYKEGTIIHKDEGDWQWMQGIDRDYYYGYTCFSSLKSALKYVNEGGTIYVSETIEEYPYADDAIINKDGIKLYSFDNYKTLLGFDATGYNSHNAYISSSIIIGEDVKDVEIKGFTFIGSGCIQLYGNNENILIQSNIFENSTLSANWQKINPTSLIYFRNNTEASNNIYINANKFLESSVTCITLSSVLNLKITNNYFYNFKLDAIKSNTIDINDSCQWLIKDNTFRHDENSSGGYNAIYFPSFGPKVVSYEHLITIFDNEFSYIGFENTNIYQNPYGAISMTGFNGGTTSVSIRYNLFNSCSSCVRIDNETNDTFFNNLEVFANYNEVIIPQGNKHTEIFSSYSKVDAYKQEKTVIEDFINAEDNYYYNSSETEFDASLYSTKNDSLKTTLTIQEINKVFSPNESGSITRAYASSVLHLDESANILVNTMLHADPWQTINASDITYESLNTSILKVSSKGELTPVAIGNATVVVKQNNQVLVNYKFKVKESINIDYASLLVSIALKEEGYVEGANNYTKYGVWYSEQVADNSFAYGAWCAMFVSWCANQANIPRSIIPLYASCAIGRQWFESRGLFKYKESYTPKTGDIIFFLSNGASHTGIVVDYRNGTVYTIEGNTSDMCHQRSYDPMNARITGYGTPQYPIYNGSKIEFDVSNATSGEGHSTR